MDSITQELRTWDLKLNHLQPLTVFDFLPLAFTLSDLWSFANPPHLPPTLPAISLLHRGSHALGPPVFLYRQTLVLLRQSTRKVSCRLFFIKTLLVVGNSWLEAYGFVGLASVIVA